MIVSRGEWKNCSVRRVADGGDPVEALVSKVRDVVFRAMEEGYTGPPFDPFDLASHLGLHLSPKGDVRDAQVIQLDDGSYKIEFNPNMPKARVKFSIAHEITHTFFPDCGEAVRNRLSKQSMGGHDWELEMLCNIGAAEMLMPIGSFPALKNESLTIENLLRLRKKFEVSTEAVLLRVTRLTDVPCFAFAASMDESSAGSGNYYLDYSAASRTFPHSIPKRLALPSNSGIKDCVAIGFESIGFETWREDFGEFEIQCVGIPPYPGNSYPRVVGIARPATRDHLKKSLTIRYVKGDATKPRGGGRKIIAHIVNDKAKKWGGRGFANFLSRTWPDVYQDFTKWCMEDSLNFSLGNARYYERNEKISTYTMISQHGYGRTSKHRVRYQAVEKSLHELYNFASIKSASVHMPRIGCGHGGGDWAIISEMIDNILINRGIEVVVYDLPS